LSWVEKRWTAVSKRPDWFNWHYPFMAEIARHGRMPISSIAKAIARLKEEG